MREFVATRGITFTMLWSESHEVTSYYRSAENRWSSFWLLDHTGDRIVGGLYEDSEQIEELLADLE